MTPQEKAMQLISKFVSLGFTLWVSKQCALIAVDEILDLNLGLSNCDENNWETEKFYEKVKKEIELL